MDAWSNIEKPRWDFEIMEIDRFEETLGELPKDIMKIRELITRVEVCHFKCKEHIKWIISSILNMLKFKEPKKIGRYHVSKGETVWKNDKTGRSKLGMKYIKGIRKWLRKKSSEKIPIRKTKEFDDNISKWLGKKNPDKFRLLKLLLARMLWDWELYKKLQKKGEFEELEKQICKIDICHYAFPSNLDLLLKSIGEMKPANDFEGCGSFNDEIKEEAINQIKYIKLPIDTSTIHGLYFFK